MSMRERITEQSQHLTDRLMEPFSTRPRLGHTQAAKSRMLELLEQPEALTPDQHAELVDYIHTSQAHDEIHAEAEKLAEAVVMPKNETNPAADTTAITHDTATAKGPIPGKKSDKQKRDIQAFSVNIAHKIITGTVSQLRQRVKQVLTLEQQHALQEKREEAKRQNQLMNDILMGVTGEMILEDENILTNENDEHFYDEQANEEENENKKNQKNKNEKKHDDTATRRGLDQEEQQAELDTIYTSPSPDGPTGETPPENASNDHYETLGLDRGASQEEIKHAYLERAMEQAEQDYLAEDPPLDAEPEKVFDDMFKKEDYSKSADEKQAEQDGKDVSQVQEERKDFEQAFDVLGDEESRDSYDSDNPTAGLSEESDALDEARSKESANNKTQNTPRPEPPSSSGGSAAGGAI